MKAAVRKFLGRCAILAVSGGSAWLAVWLIPAPLLYNRAADSTIILDRRGQLLNLGLSHDDQYRVWFPLGEISEDLQNATMRKEDQYFYQHPGVNPASLARSLVGCLFRIGACTGASTITMQLVRLRYGIRTRSLWGKLAQMGLALHLEVHYSKAEIFEAYLNYAPYGSNIVGIGAATYRYFGKSPRQITPAEARLLAAIPQRPVARTLFHAEGLAEAKRSITDPANQADLAVAGIASLPRGQVPRAVPHLAVRLRAEGARGVVPTTIDRPTQEVVQRQVEHFIERNRRLGIANATVLVVEAHSLAVRAYLGSADYSNRTIFGAVDGVLARRSPGSALKPFLYAKAIERGLIHPETLLKDTELSISNYNPENYERDFLGPISATRALILSRNIPAVSLSEQLGEDGLYELLTAAGIKKLRPKSHYGLALTLGGVEVSLQELVALYAMLDNGGVWRDISFAEGGPPGAASRRLLSEESTYLVEEMLRQNPRPDGRISVPPIAWKTGTSFGFRDAWALGMVGRYIVGVWVGNFDGAANPAFIGREAAGPLFFSIADALLARPEATLPERRRPVHVRTLEVCAVSGALPGPFCQRKMKTHFIPGVSPIATCAVHQGIVVERQSGKRVCPDQPFDEQRMITKTFEVWPSDIIRLFRAGGLDRVLPPPFAPGCQAAEGIGTPAAQSLTIVSPQGRLAYVVYDEQHRSLPLRAVAAGDPELYWFIDDRFIGVAPATETVTWDVEPGDYVVRVVTKSGAAAAVRLQVVVAKN